MASLTSVISLPLYKGKLYKQHYERGGIRGRNYWMFSATTKILYRNFLTEYKNVLKNEQGSVLGIKVFDI